MVEFGRGGWDRGECSGARAMPKASRTLLVAYREPERVSVLVRTVSVSARAAVKVKQEIFESSLGQSGGSVRELAALAGMFGARDRG